MMKKAAMFIGMLLLVLPLSAQNPDCDKVEVVEIYDFPISPNQFKIVVLLTVSDTAPSLLNIYTRLYFVNESGDSVTVPTSPSFQLPRYPSDTIPYLMTLNGLDDFPEDFKGELVTEAPDCRIPYSRGDQTTSIETPRAVDLAIYPNPVRDRLTVAADGIARIKLYSNAGQLVRHVHPDGFKSELDVGSLSAGMYLLAVQLKNGQTLARRLIKK